MCENEQCVWFRTLLMCEINHVVCCNFFKQCVTSKIGVFGIYYSKKIIGMDIAYIISVYKYIGI